MNKTPLQLLELAISSYSNLHPVGDKAARDNALQPIQSQLDNIRQIVALDRADLIKYLDDLSRHWNGALATRPTSGNSPEQHQIWANSAIRVLKRNLGGLENV